MRRQNENNNSVSKNRWINQRIGYSVLFTFTFLFRIYNCATQWRMAGKIRILFFIVLFFTKRRTINIKQNKTTTKNDGWATRCNDEILENVGREKHIVFRTYSIFMSREEMDEMSFQTDSHRIWVACAYAHFGIFNEISSNNKLNRNFTHSQFFLPLVFE